MVIRTFHKQRNIKKVLSIIVIMIIGIIAVAKISNSIYTKITQLNQDHEFYRGKLISFNGEIKNANNFPLYTHKIVDKNGEIAFLKSSSINLNNYTGKLEIYGEIKDITKDTPIIEVSTIKFPKQGLIIKNNTYFFVKDMLYLDFSNQSQLSAKKGEKDIQIFYGNERISSVERFLCSRVLRQKDCSYLIEDYGTSQKENFDSYRGYTYYKHGSGLRTVFDGTMFGYIFKDIDQDTMLSLSNIIRIVDKRFIRDNKKNIIKEACTKEGLPIEANASVSIQYEDNNEVQVTVESTKSENNCKVTLDMRNERKIIKTQKVK